MSGNGQNPSAKAKLPNDVPRCAQAPKGSKVRDVELLISDILRVGVVVSLLVIVFGTALSFVHHPDYMDQHDPLHPLTTPGGRAFPHSLREVWRELREFRGQSIVIVGLLLLIATPVVRVAVSILGFVYERDLTYVIITSVVLAMLLLSFVLGKAEG